MTSPDTRPLAHWALRSSTVWSTLPRCPGGHLPEIGNLYTWADIVKRGFTGKAQRATDIAAAGEGKELPSDHKKLIMEGTTSHT